MEAFLKKSFPILRTYHEPATQNAGRTSRRRCALYNDPEDEDASVDDDGILPRDEFGEESGVQRPTPCTQFQDGGEPSLFSRV